MSEDIRLLQEFLDEHSFSPQSTVFRHRPTEQAKLKAAWERVKHSHNLLEHVRKEGRLPSGRTSSRYVQITSGLFGAIMMHIRKPS